MGLNKKESEDLLEFELQIRKCMRSFVGSFSDETICCLFLQMAISTVFFSMNDSEKAIEFIQSCIHISRQQAEVVQEEFEKFTKSKKFGKGFFYG